MSEYRITSTMNQEIPVIGEIPQNKFHSFSCLAICQNCGLVVTKADQKVECYPCFCCTFCFFVLLLDNVNLKIILHVVILFIFALNVVIN